MKRSLRPRATAELSKPLNHQLNMYALAAGAAGVGLFASAQPTEAKIVYTPANIRIPHNGFIPLDLNHDGIADFFVVSYYQNVRTFTAFTELWVTDSNNSNHNNEVWGIQSLGSWWAAALRKNVRIGSNSAFKQASYLFMAYVGRDHGRLSGHGPWIGNKQAYLGLKFQIHGKTHYGWARLRVIARLFPPLTYPLISATLTGYAYETIPNKPILTGKTKGPDEVGDIGHPNATLGQRAPRPAILGVLAMGAPGVSVWRRREKSVGERSQAN
jgi:hypothetical protein